MLGLTVSMWRPSVTMRRAAAGALAASACALAAGCSWSDKDGRHHLVFGLGVVTVRGETLAQATSAAATPTGSAVASGGVRASGIESVEALGVFLGPGPIVNGGMVGFSRRQTVIVDPDSNLLMDATRYDDGKLIVTIQPVRAETPSAAAAATSTPAATTNAPRSSEPKKEKTP